MENKITDDKSEQIIGVEKQSMRLMEKENQTEVKKQEVQAIILDPEKHRQSSQKHQNGKADDSFEIVYNKDFFADLEKSCDLNDKLQSLADYIKENVRATGCYIGVLDYPLLPI